MKNSSRELLQVKLEDPFPAPDEFGRIRVWRDESPHSLALAAVVVAALALVAVVVQALITVVLDDQGRPGKAEVKIEQVVLGAAASGPTNLADAPEAVQSAQVPTAGPARPVDQVDQVNVQAPSGTQAVPDFQPSTNPNQAAQARAAAASLSSAVHSLEQQAAQQGAAVQIAGLSGLSGIFKVDPNVKSVVYVLDKSGSMGGRPLDVVKAELVHALSSLKPDQQFGVIFFDDLAWPMLGQYGEVPTGALSSNFKTLPATAANKQKVINWLAAVPSGGGTNPVPATFLALQAKPELIVLMSDGEFHPSAVDAIRQENHQRRGATGRINCVGLAEQIQTLQQIAAENGPGVYYAARIGP